MNVEELQKLLQAHYHLRDHGQRFKNLRKAVEDKLDALEAELAPQPASPPMAIPATPEPVEADAPEMERRV